MCYIVISMYFLNVYNLGFITFLIHVETGRMVMCCSISIDFVNPFYNNKWVCLWLF
jgi:hypothetical protein